MSLKHIEFLLETSILVTRTGKTDCRIVDTLVVQGTFLVFLSKRIVSGIQGCLIDGPVVIAILQRSGSSRRTDIKRHIAMLHVFPDTIQISHLRGSDHRLQGFFLVDVGSLGNGIRQNRCSMITAHAPVVIRHVAPDRKQSVYALLLMTNHRHSHVTGLVRLHQHQERMLGTIGIPQGENGIVGEAVCLVHVLVQSPILSIHIHINRRIDEGMIIRSIEHGLLVFRSFHFEGCKLTVPTIRRRTSQDIKIFSHGFGLEVLQCAFCAGSRKSHLYYQFRIFGVIKLEIRNDLTASHLREVGVDREFSPESFVINFLHILVTIVTDRFRQRDGKISIVGTCPSIGNAITGQQSIVFHPDLRPKRLAVVIIDTMIQVEDDTSFCIFRESITMYTYTRSSRQLGFYPIIIQYDFIITWYGFFGFVRETGTIAILRMIGSSRIQLQFAGSRHNQDIAQIGMSRTIEMRMAETYDGRIIISISGTILVYLFLIDSIYIMWNGIGIRT